MTNEETQEKDNSKDFLNNWLDKQLDEAFNIGIDAAKTVCEKLRQEYYSLPNEDPQLVIIKIINQLTQLKKEPK